MNYCTGLPKRLPEECPSRAFYRVCFCEHAHCICEWSARFCVAHEGPKFRVTEWMKAQQWSRALRLAAWAAAGRGEVVWNLADEHPCLFVGIPTLPWSVRQVKTKRTATAQIPFRAASESSKALFDARNLVQEV